MKFTENTKKVVIDTNWYISFLIKKHQSQLNSIFLNYEIEIIISPELIKEFTITIQREKFRKYFSVTDARLLIEQLEHRSTLIPDVGIIEQWCTDPKDNYLLALSKTSDADFLITGDGDLLSIGKFRNTTICTLPEFISNFEK